MPVVLCYKGYRFFFFSNEGSSREAPHVHVRREDARAKFWFSPVTLASNHGFSAVELSELTGVVSGNAKLIEGTWHEHFGD